MPKSSSFKKGRSAELEYAEMLEERGMSVYVVPKSNRWTKNKDIFNLFDIIAVDVNDVFGIQVKCNNTRGAIKKLEEWDLHPRNFKKMVAVRYDDGTWKEVWVR